jgi:hypothetical protein
MWPEHHDKDVIASNGSSQSYAGSFGPRIDQWGILVSVVCSGARQIKNGPGLGRGRLRFTHAFTKLPGASGVRPADARTTKKSMLASGPVPLEPVENSENLELRGISCFPSHSGHRGVVHRSRSETRRARLTPVVCPRNNTAESALLGPGPRRPGLLFFSRVMAMTVRLTPILAAVAITIGGHWFMARRPA